jgi:hypothetical protein
MNYLKLIQEVSKIRYRSEPSVFSDVTGSPKKYYDIRKEIENAAKDIFLDSFHNFREYKTTLTTVDGQKSYAHNYGVIKKIQCLNSDNYPQPMYEGKDYSRYEQLYYTSSESRPIYWVIYGGEIHLYPTPDTTYTLIIYYNTDKHVKQVTTIDEASNSGQKTLSVASTQGLTSGDSVTIEPNTPREEVGIIDTVASMQSIDLVSNLTYTHSSGNVEEYKDSFDYGEDEPNFPSKFHDIIETKALLELYTSLQDQGEIMKYKKQYDKRYAYIRREMKGSEKSGLRFNYRSR